MHEVNNDCGGCLLSAKDRYCRVKRYMEKGLKIEKETDENATWAK